MESGAQPGNTNATKGKEYRQALKRALARKSKKNVSAGLEAIALKLIEAAYLGEAWAIKEIADRIDGKPAQAIVGGDDDDNPIQLIGRIRLVKPGD